MVLTEHALQQHQMTLMHRRHDQGMDTDEGNCRIAVQNCCTKVYKLAERMCTNDKNPRARQAAAERETILTQRR